MRSGQQYEKTFVLSLADEVFQIVFLYIRLCKKLATRFGQNKERLFVRITNNHGHGGFIFPLHLSEVILTSFSEHHCHACHLQSGHTVNFNRWFESIKNFLLYDSGQILFPENCIIIDPTWCKDYCFLQCVIKPLSNNIVRQY